MTGVFQSTNERTIGPAAGGGPSVTSHAAGESKTDALLKAVPSLGSPADQSFIEVSAASAPRHKFTFPRDQLLDPHGFTDGVIVAANAQFFEPTVEGAYQNTVGGLVSGVCPVLCGLRGSSVISADVKGSLADFKSWEDRPFDAIGVPIPPDEYASYYLQYSNSTLWPAFHGLEDKVKAPDAMSWSNYCMVNRRFANEIAKTMKGSELVWIHDYHLTLAPDFLRADRPNAPIAYFHHIPWPDPASLRRMLPPHQLKGMLKGLLGCDLVAFHTMGYVRNFLDSVRDAGIGATVHYESNSISFGSRTVSVGAFPISVDTKGIEAALKTDLVQDKAREFRARYPGQRIMFGVERLDYTKGIEERLLAVELMLDQRPELKGVFTMVQYAPPSRDGVEEYKILRTKVETAAARINDRFGAEKWKPVDLRLEKLDHDTVLGYCHGADAVVVTPLIDGMNLVIKEAVLAAREGTAFVLGEGAGAAAELREAFLVDGRSPESIAGGMIEALNSDRRQLAAASRALKRRVHEYPVSLWGQEIVAASREAVERRHEPPHFNHPRGGILERQASRHIQSMSPHRRAGRLSEEFASPIEIAQTLTDSMFTLMAVDYDGCLVPIVARPELAVIDDLGIRNLRAAANEPNTALAIVSGRSVDQLKHFLRPLAGENILLCGLHGGEIYDFKEGKALTELSPSLEVQVTQFEAKLRECMAKGGLAEPPLLIENKRYSLALHFRAASMLENAADTAMFQAYLSGEFRHDFEIRRGKMVLEFVPRCCSKGSAVEYLFARASAVHGSDVHIFVAGDDVTDESAFKKAKELDSRAVTVRIGDLATESEAAARLPSTEALHETIELYLNNRAN